MVRFGINQPQMIQLYYCCMVCTDVNNILKMLGTRFSYNEKLKKEKYLAEQGNFFIRENLPSKNYLNQWSTKIFNLCYCYYS